MTDLRQAAQQALEALDKSLYMNAYCGLEVSKYNQPDVTDAIEALRAALAASEPKTPWAHLPNAAHIDRILAHAKAHPDKWSEAWGIPWHEALGESWNVARGATRGEALGAIVALIDWGDALGAIVALIAWDEARELLSLPRSEVRDMADESDNAAVLIYPAMLAMGEEK